MSKEQLLSKLNKLRIKMVDYFHLIFKSTHFNYYRIESCKKDETGKIHCDITFDSYSALRQFQNKLRKISFGVGSLVTTTVIVSLIINLSTGPVINSWAATFNFTQSDWDGLADNTSTQSGWTKYSSSTPGIIASSTISLATTSGEMVQTDDTVENTGFNLTGNNNSQTTVSGTGTGTSVQLAVMPGQFGTGADGAVTISTAKNINTDTIATGRTCADGISYNVVSLTANTATLSGTPPAGCFAAGDKVMLLNEQGDGTNLTNVGNYEFLNVQSISGNVITFTGDKMKYYGNGASDDFNLGLTSYGGNDAWTTLSPLPSYSNHNDNLVYPGFGDYIYRLQKISYDSEWFSNEFSAYSISNNSWITFNPADAPGAVFFHVNPTLVYPGSGDYIYALMDEDGSPSFLTYSISNNSWATFDPVDPSVGVYRPRLVYPGSGDYIYLSYSSLSGDFRAYSISNNNWTTFNPADAPSYIGEMIYPGSGDYIYALRDATPSFFAYSISNNDWTTFNPADAPSEFNTSGAVLAYPGSGDYIYADKGGSPSSFWAYSISNNNWTTFDPTNVPTFLYNGAQQPVAAGGHIYATRGDGTIFYRYTPPAQQRVVIQRIPQYTDVTITTGGSLTANAWDGTKGGVLAFYASGNVNVQSGGSVTMSGKGYRIRTGGESYNGMAPGWAANYGGGAFDDVGCCDAASYSGGGYGSAGQTVAAVAGGSIYGSSDLSKIYMGSAGGAYGYGLANPNNGGGIVFITADSISVSGTVSNNGVNAGGSTYAGGSGGSIYLKSTSLTLDPDTVTAVGGNSFGSNQGAGGAGRIHVQYGSTISGTTNPTAATSSLPIVYYSNGTSTSGIIDTGQKISTWGNLSWTANTPANTGITIKVRSLASATTTGAVDWADCVAISSGSSLSDGGCITAGHRYVQYQAILSGDTVATPSLDDVTIAYSYYISTGSLISSAFNSNDVTNVLAGVTWASSTPVGTDVRFQIRTGSTTSELLAADWRGADGEIGTYFIAQDGSEGMPAIFSSNNNDQYFQYKVTLTSEGDSSPSVDDINVIYVVNASPEVTVASVAQTNTAQTIESNTSVGSVIAATGTVIVNYTVKDIDTDQGATVGTVIVGMQYYDQDLAEWMDIATSSILGLPADGVVSVSSSTPTAYALVWNPNIEYDNKYFSTGFMIRITADDSEVANNITASSSPEFIIDTKAPIVDIGTAIKVDARQTNEMAIANEIAIIFQATDISGVYYRYSVSSSTDGNGFLLPAAGVTDANSGQWILKNTEGIATTTVKVASETDKIYIQYRDGLDNFNPTIYNVTIPTSVNSIMVQDVTNTYIDPSDVQLYLAWRESSLPLGGTNAGEFKAYYIERAEYASDPGLNFVPGNTDFVQVSSSTDRQVNYYTDNNVVEDYHYYYRVYIEDGVGNFSYYTGESDTNIVMHGVPNGIQDFGEGGGGTSVGIPPVISSVEVAETLTTQAKIIWNTDILANSSVEYITAVGTTTPTVEDFANAPFKGVATMLNNAEGLGKHNVVIDGLDSNTQYYFRVKSTGIDGTEGTSFNETYQFTTLDGPRIASSTIIVTGKTNDSLTIEWNTDIVANSFVGYSTDSNMTNPAPVEVGQDDSVTNHSVTINSLAPGTRYFFYVKSGTGKDNNLGNYYNDMTTTDATAPSFIGTATSTPKRTSVLITWQTDEVSDSTITIGTSTGAYSQTITDEVLTMYHVIAINSLSASSTYYYKVISSDANGNVATSTEYMFTTEGVALTNVIAVTTGETSVDITWNTDENTTSQVLYSTSSAGLIGGTYKPVLPDDSTQNHSVTIDNLINSTKYYYRVISTVDGFTVESPIYYFTSGDISAPTISDVQAINISTNAATINWTTDETADTLVEWGTESGIYTASTSNSALTRTHSIAISGLDTFNRYYYRVISQDVNSNATTSQEYDFTTANFTISDVFADAATSSVIVTWTTDELTSSQVEYTTDANFVSGLTSYPTSPNDATTTHSITITGLSDGLYYYRVHSAKDNQDNASIIYTFSISDDQGAPVISGLQTSTITDTSAVIYWTTDESSDSVIYYGTTADGQYASSTENPIPTTLHFITLNNLSASTTYYFYVESSDGSANMATSAESSFTTLSLRYSGDDLAEELQSMEDEIAALTAELATKASLLYSQADLQTRLDQISTLEDQLEEANNKSSGGMLVIDKTDKVAPKISNVKMAEVGDTYAKITWDTDEDSSSMIGYGFTDAYDSAESDYQSYIKRSKGHTVYLRKLLPSSSYHFAVVSADSSGNMSSSPDFTLTTLAAGEEAKKNMEAEAKQDAENTLTKIQEMINELLASGKVNPEDIRSAIQKTGEPPMISGAGPEISDLTAKSVTISWKTNRKSNSIISYYIESMGRDSAEQIGNYSALVTDHTVKISNLAPGRKYVFTAQSVDALGNVGASDQKSFETVGIPFISEVSMSNITNTSVDISWLSNTETSSELDYGSTVAYGKNSRSNSSDYVLNHSIRLNDLKPGQTYHFKAKGVSRKGDIISSDDYTFTTLTSFDVLTYSINKITDKSANINWKTTNDSTSEIEYTNTATKVTDSVKAGEFTKDHNIKLVNLIPGTRYTFKIKGKDKFEQATESEGFEFSTLIDTQAPIIEYVQTDMALISKGDQNSVQAVVTWKTNEPSTSEIIYAEGGAKNLPTLDSSKTATSTDKKVSSEEVSIGNDKFTIAKDGGGMTQKHVLVITDFKPSTVYTFKARSIDEAGNVSYSKDYTVLAPSKEESVLQIIIKTFEDTFGWLKMK